MKSDNVSTSPTLKIEEIEKEIGIVNKPTTKKKQFTIQINHSSLNKARRDKLSKSNKSNKASNKSTK